MTSEMNAYVPPHLRGEGQQNRTPRSRASDSFAPNNRQYQNRNSSYNQRRTNEKRVRFNDQPYVPSFQSQIEVQRLEHENKELKNQMSEMEKKLSFYTSRGAKVPEQDYIDLENKFKAYKDMKYKEFSQIKIKLDNHDQEVLGLNREIKRMEDQVRVAELKVKQYESSIKDLNEKIRILSQHQVEAVPPPSVEAQKFSKVVPDDWKILRRAADYVLSFKSKDLNKNGFTSMEIAALKQARSDINDIE